MSLLKVKVTSKFESKLYNYNKILKYINKILNYYFYRYYIIMYIRILSTINVIVYSCTLKKIRTLIHK